MAETERHLAEEMSVDHMNEAGEHVEDVEMEEPPSQVPTSEEQSVAKGSRLWNPIRDTNTPSEENFQGIEVAFGRFVNFLKNREEAGLSPESVRLLHTFYTELDAASAAGNRKSLACSGPGVGECPVWELANLVPLKKQLKGRHLHVLVNTIMFMVEAEQKEVQRLLRLSAILTEATENGETGDSLHDGIRAYDPQKLLELKAITQEHIRLKIDFVAKLKTGRSLMVKCLDGSNRLLEVLRKKAARHERKQTQQEMAQLRESFKQSTEPSL